MRQEPIAFINVEERKLEFAKPIMWHTPTVVNLERIPLYTHQRTWVRLTNNELQPIADAYRILFGSWVEEFAREIEAKLKELNT